MTVAAQIAEKQVWAHQSWWVAMRRQSLSLVDRSVMTLDDARRQESKVDVFCLKLYKVGGIHKARQIAAIAGSANVLVNVGGLVAFSQLEAAADIHFHTSLHPSKVMPAGEFLFGLGTIGPDPLVPEPSYSVEDGCVRPCDLPGLGVTLDDAAVSRLTLFREVDTA